MNTQKELQTCIHQTPQITERLSNDQSPTKTRVVKTKQRDAIVKATRSKTSVTQECIQGKKNRKKEKISKNTETSKLPVIPLATKPNPINKSELVNASERKNQDKATLDELDKIFKDVLSCQISSQSIPLSLASLNLQSKEENQQLETTYGEASNKKNTSETKRVQRTGTQKPSTAGATRLLNGGHASRRIGGFLQLIEHKKTMLAKKLNNNQASRHNSIERKTSLRSAKQPLRDHQHTLATYQIALKKAQLFRR